MTILIGTDLSVRTAAGESLLSDVAVRVNAGESVVVAGRSGSGKTILTRALAGVLEDHPNFRVEGTVTRPDELGVLFQNPETQLVRRTVRHDVAFGLENLGVPRAEMTSRIETWAERLDVADLLDREVRGLSRGETTLVALLGTLVTEPEVVILDEPLATLDRPNRKRVLTVLETLQERGTAMLVAEHDLRNLLGRVDRLLLLADGTVAERGDPASLLPHLRAAGLTLPFETEVALERGRSPESIPLTSTGTSS
ncbi:MAG: energy-coupling factor ABC transporter ATP-binding protein [Halodesulfurarchaeum sp.]